jgi:CBS domain-containing protein
MLTASDIMRKDVTTVPPDMTVEEVGRLFIERNESGFPVVDGEGNLLGIVTENDLLNRNKKLHIPTVLRIFDAFIPLEGFDALDHEIRKMAAVVVSEICTPEPVTVAEDAPIEEIATVMAEQKLHHLPVLRDKKLVGMVDQHDVIKGISGGGRQDPDS